MRLVAVAAAGSAGSEWGTDMAYDINAALSPFDALGAISSGQQAMQGFQTLRNNAQTMRSRAAMARALQGDRSAMADVQDPEMLAKLQEHFRQQDIREGIKGFYNTLDQDRIGVNNLATLASAKPKGFDLAGATQYALSQGAFEEAKPMMELAKLSKANDKYGNTLMPAYDKTTGEFVFIQPGGESGARPITGYTPAEPLIQVDQGTQRVLVGGKTGHEKVSYQVGVDPTTVYSQGQQAVRQERGAVLDVGVEAEKERIRLQNAAELERRKAQGQNLAAREEKVQERLTNAQEALATILPLRDALSKLRGPAGMRAEQAKAWLGFGNPEIQGALGQIQQISGSMLKYVERLPGAATDADREIFMASAGILNDPSSTPQRKIGAANAAIASYERLIRKHGGAKQGAGFQQRTARNPAKAANWLKSRNIKNQSQFNDAVVELKKMGWSDDEIRAASEGM